MTTEAEKRLRPKYIVEKIQEGDKEGFLHSGQMLSTNPNDVNSPFVLMPRKDPAAYAAMIYYAQVCEPKLALEIVEWLAKIAMAPPEFGTQGIRNFATTRAAALEQV